MRFHIDTELPETVDSANGHVLLLKGWAFSPKFRTRRMWFRVGGELFPVHGHSMARPDVFHANYPDTDLAGGSLVSGFWGLVRIPAGGRGDLPIELVISGGIGRKDSALAASVNLVPGAAREPHSVTWPGEGPKVAICMATYNPPMGLFRRQIESLKAQTHRNWVCIITDDQSPDAAFANILETIGTDARFIVKSNNQRLNFYGNFERAMSMVPADADYVALCDQDDRWDDDKVEILIAAFQGDVQLVYSDARLTDAEGNVLSETFWYNRRNNYTNLRALLVANTVTGAASMFRAALLDKILPLPQRVGDAYHDHWMALAAMANGSIGYVDRPLYDYVQHDANVIGHFTPSQPGLFAFGWQIIKAMRCLEHAPHVAMRAVNHGVFVHQYVERTALFATLAASRSAPDNRNHRTFRHFERFGTGLWRPFIEKVKAVIQRRPTLNLEGFLLHSVLSTKVHSLYYRARYRDRSRLRQRPKGGERTQGLADLGRFFVPTSITDDIVKAPGRRFPRFWRWPT